MYKKEGVLQSEVLSEESLRSYKSSLTDILHGQLFWKEYPLYIFDSSLSLFLCGFDS